MRPSFRRMSHTHTHQEILSISLIQVAYAGCAWIRWSAPPGSWRMRPLRWLSSLSLPWPSLVRAGQPRRYSSGLLPGYRPLAPSLPPSRLAPFVSTPSRPTLLARRRRPRQLYPGQLEASATTSRSDCSRSTLLTLRKWASSDPGQLGSSGTPCTRSWLAIRLARSASRACSPAS